MSGVTDLAKRYTWADRDRQERPRRGAYLIVCLGCDALHLALRRDARVCSTRCRVRVHRRPDHARDAFGVAHHVPAGMERQAAGVLRVLGREGAERIATGEMTIGPAQDLAQGSFWALMFAALMSGEELPWEVSDATIRLARAVWEAR